MPRRYRPTPEQRHFIRGMPADKGTPARPTREGSELKMWAITG